MVESHGERGLALELAAAKRAGNSSSAVGVFRIKLRTACRLEEACGARRRINSQPDVPQLGDLARILTALKQGVT